MATLAQLIRTGYFRALAQQAPPDPTKMEFDYVTEIHGSYGMAAGDEYGMANEISVGFSTPVNVGRCADGQVVVLCEEGRTFNYEYNPASQFITTTTTFYNESVGPNIPAGTNARAHGAMRDPFLPTYWQPSVYKALTGGQYGLQGADKLLEWAAGTGSNARMHYGDNKKATSSPYADTSEWLNTDPALGNGRGVINGGEHFSELKTKRKDGLRQPPIEGGGGDEDDGSWRFFQAYMPVHFVNFIPPRDVIAPSVCSIGDEKNWTITKGLLDAGVFGEALEESVLLAARAAGLMTKEAANASRLFAHSFQPFIGQLGEMLRRWVIIPGRKNGEGGGYTRDYGQQWSNYLAGLLAEGAGSISPVDMVKIATFANQLDGITKRLILNPYEKDPAGAGQFVGHKQFYMIGAAMAADHDPEMLNRANLLPSNTTDLAFKVEPRHVGIPVYTDGEGNHDVEKGTPQEEQLGMYLWNVNALGYKGWPGERSMDAIYPSDYESESNGVAASCEATVLGMMVIPRYALTGWQWLTGGTTFANFTKPQGEAAWGYIERYYAINKGSIDLYSASRYGSFPAWAQSLYKNLHTTWGLENLVCPPEAPNVDAARTSAVLTVGRLPGVVDVDLRVDRVAGNTGPISRIDLRWTYDDEIPHWTYIEDVPEQYAITGLVPTKPVLVSWRRWSVVNGTPQPSIWSPTFPRVWGAAKRGRVIPTGTPPATPAVNLELPLFVRPKYPLWKYSDYVPVEYPNIDVTKGKDLTLTPGKWEGNIIGSPTFSHKRGATEVATTPTSGLTKLDLLATRNGTVTYNGVSADALPLGVPDRPALPANVYAKLTMGPEDELWNWELYEDMIANSKSDPSASLKVLPIVRTDYIILPDGSLEVGFAYGAKNGNNPRIRVNLAARKAIPNGAMKLRVKVGLGLTNAGNVTGDIRLKLGTTITDTDVGTQLMAQKIVPVEVLSGSGTSRIIRQGVYETTYDVVGIAGSLAYLQHMIATGVGLNSGGNPEILEIELYVP